MARSDNNHPITNAPTPSDNDVLFGRGGLSNIHKGNRIFRRLVRENRTRYQQMTNPAHKQCLILSIVKAVQRAEGRFLRKGDDGSWVEAEIKEIRRKTAQALRENNENPTSSSDSVVSTQASSVDQEQIRDDEATPEDCFEPLQIDSAVAKQKEKSVERDCFETLKLKAVEFNQDDILVQQQERALPGIESPFAMESSPSAPRDEYYEPLHIDTVPSAAVAAAVLQVPSYQQDERVLPVPTPPIRQETPQSINNSELFDRDLLDRVLGSANSPNRFSRRRRLMH